MTRNPRSPSGPVASLMLAAIGVVFGDIGTSPLYTVRECFGLGAGLEPSPDNVLGILSLIVWSILLVIAVKYVLFVMRADNRGEGGVMALMALAGRTPHGRRATAITLLGLAGTALFIGDSMITPAISVLSAVEGVEVAAPPLEPVVVPVALVVLLGLFLLQSHGTQRVGALFGPVMLVWFVGLAGLGAPAIVRSPGVLAAVWPSHALGLAERDPLRAFLALGAVVLALTGAEALYADMGHFGRHPIRLAWFVLVMPALLLNYLGQGAVLLGNPGATGNPFFLMAPAEARGALVVLATAATVIASQAVISGAFSLAGQAIRLGLSPRLELRQTSESAIGQIYLPVVNWGLMMAVVALVLGFKRSSALASAYGIAVTGTMLATTIMALVVARRRWRWPIWMVAAAGTMFVGIDLLFFSANLLKVPDGGWFPLAVGAVVFLLMTTWRRGRQILAQRRQQDWLPLEPFLAQLAERPVPRVQGTAVFLTGIPDHVPPALLHNLKHNKVLHRRVVFAHVRIADLPHLPETERIVIETLAPEVHRLTLKFGFMEETDVPAVLERCGPLGLAFDLMDTSFFISREILVPTSQPGMALWRESLFAAMARNAAGATDAFCIPANRVVELGTQILL